MRTRVSPATWIVAAFALVGLLWGSFLGLRQAAGLDSGAADAAERDVRLANRIGVVVIVLRFAEEEHVLVVGRGAGLYSRGHSVGFVPDAITAQDPAFGLESQSHLPRQAELLAVCEEIALVPQGERLRYISRHVIEIRRRYFPDQLVS